MDKQQMITVLSQLAIVIGGVLLADVVKNQLAKKQITKPFEVKAE